MKIINLTQHEATAAQLAAGVFEPSAKDKDLIKLNLTFDEIPTHIEIMMRANALAHIASQYDLDLAMIGGAPFLMSTLEDVLECEGITALYAFSQRQSVEVDNGNGGVRKTAAFKHLGFVEV